MSKPTLLSKIKHDIEARDAGIQATYDADELLIKLAGNFFLRGIELSQVERTLLDAAILKLSEARGSLNAIDLSMYGTY